MGVSSFLRKLEVKPTDDEYEAIETSRWGNKDVYPIPHDKRTYGIYAFVSYWGTCGICLSSWTIGSSLIGIGLTAGQAMAAVTVGMLIACANAYLNGTPGAKHHLGYGMLARAAFGMWGSYFCIMLNVFQSFVFYGTQMYFGGQAFVLILNSIFPSFLRMKNTLPESAGITTPGLIGFVLFIILYFPIIYFVPAWKVQKLLEVQIIVATVTLLGIMGWAVHENGGSPGNLVAPAIKLSKAEAGFRVIQGITSVAGTYTGGSDRVSDWTRYGRRRHSSTPAIAMLAFTVILTALVGIISTSALYERYGMLEWNPLIMLQWVQQNYYTPKCRAGTFFAGVGLLSVTIFVNYTQNCVSSGMDVAMIFPRYVSQRRGAIIFSICGVLANPWRFLTQAETFITVLSSFGVFMSPAAAILIVDFWIIRRQKWNIPELYLPGGTYWFTAGCNWRAFLAYFLGMWPALPGFVNAVSGKEVAVTWRRFYQISFFFGYAVSAILFYAFCKISPPPALGVQVSFDVDGTQVVEKMPEGMKEDGLEKGVEVDVTKVSTH
ncbi:permease for cytosine/purines, uracil, thiamine, allantoin-domain-containing protein [Clohesyomyces aquaticus]|uniref:Permease for cytosine/purines, uracil, thiamine, allantoin-domain-containing protein n=1 Tax=Clohesyomyces aquaticus TaxID=1231657 RepID=A0A1Y1YD53_9PLEO|nr:permease for cytosine/purines, uracil, thiamine, allantoin-domain-containing protein [Clohesyomyces aquaticus]